MANSSHPPTGCLKTFKTVSFVFRLENCVLIPHIGSATFQTRTRMATLTAENLIAAISGQNMPAELK